MAWRFKLRGVEELTGDGKAAVLVGIGHGLEKIVVRGEQLVKEEAPVGATGQLANSANHLVEGTRAEIFIGPPADVYGAAVEAGTRPHFPPPDALIPWVIKKFNPNSDAEAREIAWLIARAIAKRGTKGQLYFKRATDQLGKEARGILEFEIAEALDAAGFGEAA